MSDRTKLLAVMERGELVVLFGHDGVFHGETFRCSQGQYDQHSVLSWLAERWIADKRPSCFDIHQHECITCYLHFLQMRSHLSIRLGERLLLFLEAQLKSTSTA